VGLPLWPELGSVVCHSQSLSQLPLIYIHKTTYNVQEFNNLYTIFTRPLSVQAQYGRLCPITSSFCYNGSLVTWTIVCLTVLWPTLIHTYNVVNDENHLRELRNYVYHSVVLENLNSETMHFQTYVDINYFYYLLTRNSFLKLCRVYFKHSVY
jgi:hypothetical protein